MDPKRQALEEFREFVRLKKNLELAKKAGKLPQDVNLEDEVAEVEEKPKLSIEIRAGQPGQPGEPELSDEEKLQKLAAIRNKMGKTRSSGQG